MHLRNLVVSFFMLGFLTDFTSVAELYYMREFGLSVPEITSVTGYLFLPWLIKPLFGKWSDSLAGVECQALCCLFFTSAVLWLILGNILVYVWTSICILVVGEIAPAFGIAIAEAGMVRYTRKHRDWNAPQWCIMARVVGRCTAVYAGSACVGLGYAIVYHIQAILTVLFCAMLMADGDIAEDGQEDEAFDSVVEEKDRVPPGKHDLNIQEAFVIVLFCQSVCPSTQSAISLFLSGPLNAEPNLIGVIEAMDIFSVVGSAIVASGTWMRDAFLLHACLACMVFANGLQLLVLVRHGQVADGTLLILAAIIISLAQSTMHAQFSDHTSRLVPKGKEGYYYSLYTYIPNMGKLAGIFASEKLSEYFSIDHTNFGRLVDFHGLTTAMLACVLFLPAAMPL